MKKLLLISIFALICLNSFAQSGVYHHFPTQNAIWKEETHDYIPMTSAQQCDHYQIELSGDTVAGSYTYHKLRKRGYHWAYWWCGAPASIYTPSYFDAYVGAMREDTLQKKVYLLLPNHNTDTLLYDFDLHLGDTVQESYINYSNGTVIVTSVDSVLIGTAYHKSFGLSAPGFSGIDTNFVYLIEGVGSTFGLINYFHPMFEVPAGSSLECFRLNGVTVYPGSGYNCSLITSIEQQSITAKCFTLAPNPFSQSTLITLDQSYQSITLEVFDIQGKRMLQQQYNNTDRIILNRNQLSNGMYFLKLNVDGKLVETRKMVVGE